MKRGLLALAATVATAGSAAAAESPVVGVGQAKDGDSLTVGGREVRLFGIDAPEFDQTCTRDEQTWACGAAAADQLAKLVTGRQVICLPTGVDRYQRVLARCMAGSSDINSRMVELGHAVAYRQYSSDYVAAEERAKLARRGLWAGKFELPSDYRRGDSVEASQSTKRSAPKASSSDWAGRAKANCSIKGNRNRRGQWIYHLPGMPYYEQTRPEEIFCTEQEARAAGYRRAIVR